MIGFCSFRFVGEAAALTLAQHQPKVFPFLEDQQWKKCFDATHHQASIDRLLAELLSPLEARSSMESQTYLQSLYRHEIKHPPQGKEAATGPRTTAA